MADFITYRNGKTELPQRLKDAVADFYAQRRVLPGLVVVNTSELAKAKKAAKTLELAAEVRASGGCLVPEVWLAERQKTA